MLAAASPACWHCGWRCCGRRSRHRDVERPSAAARVVAAGCSPLCSPGLRRTRAARSAQARGRARNCGAASPPPIPSSAPAADPAVLGAARSPPHRRFDAARIWKPRRPRLLAFGHWLEPSSAASLKEGLDALFVSGHRSTSSCALPAAIWRPGPHRGSRAILRRDVAYRDEVARVMPSAAPRRRYAPAAHC